MNTFSITESFKFAWEKIKSNSRDVFSATVILAALELLARFSKPAMGGGSALLTVVSVILMYVLSVGFTIMVLKMSRGEPAELRELVPPMKLLWQYFLASFAVGLIALAGLAVPALLGAILGYLLHVAGLPGVAVIGVVVLGAAVGMGVAVWVIVRYFFVRFMAIDGVRSIGDILRESSAMSRDVQGNILLFLFAIIVIGILGAITIIGLLISIPLTMFAIAHAYLHMTGKLAVTTAVKPSSVQPAAE